MKGFSHADTDRLLREIVLPFHEIKRTHRLPVGRRRWENDAEHSWSVAFLACAVANKIDKTLDVGKVSQLAIAHDIVELYAGDTPFLAHESMHATKQEREAKAMERIATEFRHFPWLVSIIQEYEQRKTNEAKFVCAVDKYIAVAYDLIDEARVMREQKVTLAEYNNALKPHRKKAHGHSKVALYYEEVRSLLDAHPEYFHSDT
jgi:putative hydrolase of HD superfamily